MFVIDLQMNDPISASSYNVALSLERENYDCFSFSMTYITMISTDTNSYAFFNYFLLFMTSYNDDIRRILKFLYEGKSFSICSGARNCVFDWCKNQIKELIKICSSAKKFRICRELLDY